MSLLFIVRMAMTAAVIAKDRRHRPAEWRARVLEYAPAGLRHAVGGDRPLPNGAVGLRGRDPSIQVHLPSTPVVSKEFPRHHHLFLERVTFMIRLVNLRRGVTDSETTCVMQGLPQFPVFRMSPLVVGSPLHLWATSQAVGPSCFWRRLDEWEPSCRRKRNRILLRRNPCSSKLHSKRN